LCLPLGGAALQRCDKQPVFQCWLQPLGATAASTKSFSANCLALAAKLKLLNERKKCHPERSSRFAKRSSYVVEEPALSEAEGTPTSPTLAVQCQGILPTTRVERTLLSAAFDSCPEKREWSRSSRTGQQPDAKSKEFIPPSGDATRPKSPALRFAIGRATPL
jgi:hypothetical protein